MEKVGGSKKKKKKKKKKEANLPTVPSRDVFVESGIRITVSSSPKKMRHVRHATSVPLRDVAVLDLGSHRVAAPLFDSDAQAQVVADGGDEFAAALAVFYFNLGLRSILRASAGESRALSSERALRHSWGR